MDTLQGVGAGPDLGHVLVKNLKLVQIRKKNSFREGGGCGMVPGPPLNPPLKAT